MRIWKLVSGVISICLAVLLVSATRVLSIYAAMASAFAQTEIDTDVFLFASLLFLGGGICAIASRDGGVIENILAIVGYVLGALAGLYGIMFVTAAFDDMVIGSIWAILCAIVQGVALHRDIQYARSYEYEERMQGGYNPPPAQNQFQQRQQFTQQPQPRQVQRPVQQAPAQPVQRPVQRQRPVQNQAPQPAQRPVQQAPVQRPVQQQPVQRQRSQQPAKELTLEEQYPEFDLDGEFFGENDF